MTLGASTLSERTRDVVCQLVTASVLGQLNTEGAHRTTAVWQKFVRWQQMDSRLCCFQLVDVCCMCYPAATKQTDENGHPTLQVICSGQNQNSRSISARCSLTMMSYPLAALKVLSMKKWNIYLSEMKIRTTYISVDLNCLCRAADWQNKLKSKNPPSQMLNLLIKDANLHRGFLFVSGSFSYVHGAARTAKVHVGVLQCALSCVI